MLILWIFLNLTVCDEILNIYRANIYPRSVTLIDQDKNVIDSSKIKILKSHRNAILALYAVKTFANSVCVDI
mgnify:CR=1 FL=1